jgi:hypothetical protein
VQDYVPKNHHSRFNVALVRERLDLSEIDTTLAALCSTSISAQRYGRDTHSWPTRCELLRHDLMLQRRP